VEAPAISEMKAELFRALGHPMRVRILERLVDGERSVSELQALLGIDVGGISAHLATLRKQSLVEARRDGTSVFYRVKDPRVLQLLDLTRQMLSAQLEDAQALLRDLNASANDRPAVTS
jgi:ArsR family transcriptional regulator